MFSSAAVKGARLVGVGASVLAILLTGCDKGQGKGAHLQAPEGTSAGGSALPPARVSVEAVETKPMVTSEEVVGTVRPKRRATLESRLSGRIESMPVLLGDRIQKGQLVARLAIPEVKARLEQAEAGLEQANRDWKRASALFEQQSVTRSDLDNAESRLAVARGVAQEAAAMMGYVEVVAPFDGLVTRKWVDMGDLASPGKPLVDIEDPTALQLETNIPEGMASRITRGARFEVRLDSASGMVEGVVSEIASAADPASRTSMAKLDLPDHPGLRTGQFARLVLPIGESQAVMIPVGAVVRRGQLEIVFTVDQARARMRLVKTGRQVGERVEVLSGLVAGEKVVIDGASRLVDGQSLEVR